MIWLNPEQLKKIGVSKGMLHRNREKWTQRSTGVRGRNGKVTFEILLESMPTKFQEAWLRLDPRQTVEPPAEDTSSLTTESSLAADLGGAAADAVDVSGTDGDRRLVEALTRYATDTRGAFLAEAQRLSSIVEKYESITPKRVKNAAGEHEFVEAVLALCEEARCVDPVILAIEPSREKTRSPHTLDCWLKAFRKEGLTAFLRKPPTPTGVKDKRKAEISAAAVEWLEKNWRSKPSPRKLYQALKKEAKKHGWKIPAEGWIWRKYNELPKIVKVLTFEGDKAYTGKLAPFVPRTVEDITALQILVGDHSVRDVTVMLPDGSLTRPWLTMWQDVRTGLIWGWHLDLTPSSNTIGLAYVNGVRNFGAQPLSNPDAGFHSYLYTDQGKDYRSKTLTGQTLEFKKAARIEGGLQALCTQRNVGFMNELGLKHLMARGYNAREKFIERTHKDISAWEQNTFESEYCGRGTEHKPERWSKAWATHQRLLKKFKGNLQWLLSESPFITLDDYRENLAGWITEYNHTAHTRSVLGGSRIVPVEEYERLYTTRYEISDDALALLLMKADKRKIGKDGVQMFQSHWYFLHEEMSAFKGEQVEIRYTDGDYSRIWAVLPNGKIVEASLVTPSSILNPNKKTMQAIAQQRSHEKRVVKDFRFIQESNYRGETVEDRVAAMVNDLDDMPPEEQRMAVNAAPRVINLTRFDKPKSGAGRGSSITDDQVESAAVIEGMFGNRSADDSSRIREEWE